MKKASRIIVFITVGMILITTFRFLWSSSLPETLIYEIISPAMGYIDYATTVTGNIEPRNETAVKPEIQGIVSKILKKTGQSVKEGEIIAILEVIPDAGQLNAAESRLRQSRITLDQVSDEYNRMKMLYENGVISRNEYEVHLASYRKAQEEITNAKDALDIIKNGSANTYSYANNTQVRSRSSGTILDIPVKEGNMVIHSNAFNEGTTIAIVADMSDLVFIGTIDETEVGSIREGMPICISVGAIPNEIFEAEIEYIAPKGKKENGSVTYEIKATVRVPNTAKILRANYSANADIVIDRAKNVIVIPESAVEFSKEGIAYVYVLHNDSKNQSFVKKPIVTGLSDGNMIEVISGLSQGDLIRGRIIESLIN